MTTRHVADITDPVTGETTTLTAATERELDQLVDEHLDQHYTNHEAAGGPQMDQQRTPPTLAEVLGTLNELGAAARAGEVDRYRAALRLAKSQDLTEEQISDAYRWGRRHEGAAAFDWEGNSLLG